MEDGLVVYITEEISQILGYPKDMWMGRSFMDLVHPKDKMAFASQFTFSGGITFPTGGDLNLGQKGKHWFSSLVFLGSLSWFNKSLLRQMEAFLATIADFCKNILLFFVCSSSSDTE